IYRCMFVLLAFAARKPPQVSMHGAALAEPGCSNGLDASARPPRSSVRIRFRVTAFARYLRIGAMRECAYDPVEISPGVLARHAGQGAPADRAAAPRRTLGHALPGPPRRAERQGAVRLRGRAETAAPEDRAGHRQGAVRQQ